MNSQCQASVTLLIIFLACSTAEINKSHSLAKRQLPARGGGNFPLSRSRQFPPPEEIEEVEPDVSEEDSDYDSRSQEEPAPARRFRGRQQPPTDEDYHYTEVPPSTTTAPQTEPTKSTNRPSALNNRPSRPRFGAQSRATTSSTTSAPRITSAPSPRFRTRSSSAPAERIDVVTDISNKPPPSRSRSIANPGTSNNREPAVRKPLLDETNSPATRRIGTGRVRARGKPRARSTTTTTTTTTTQAPDEEYYYYYYDDDESAEKRPIATTTTTTTTTTKRPSLPRRGSLGRGRPAGLSSRSTSKPRAPVKFDPETQFVPPPEDGSSVPLETTRVTKRFTTSTTEPPGPGGIPAHLKGKYVPRSDGRFIDYLRDPNRPRELKGFDLTEYPFYIRVPEEIDFDCNDKKDGYYASVPHHCQLFHYCFAGSRYDFLCANYTLYDQTTFTCRFANNVDCPSSANFYYRNDDLWKETTTKAAPTPEPKKKKITPKDDNEEEYEYDDEEYYDEDEDDTKRRRRPSRRRRNRRRKNTATPTTEAP